MFVFNPEDIIILIGIIFITLQDPFRNYISFESYNRLKKQIPYAVPYPIVFAIVWIALYMLIAVAIFLIFLERASIHTWVGYALFSLYGGILVCTKIWTPLFFGLHDYIVQREQKEKKPHVESVAYVAYIIALVDLAVLLMFIICFIIFSMVADPDYGHLFWLPALFISPAVPWLLYAGYLNLSAVVVAYAEIDAPRNIKKNAP